MVALWGAGGCDYCNIHTSIGKQIIHFARNNDNNTNNSKSKPDPKRETLI